MKKHILILSILALAIGTNAQTLTLYNMDMINQSNQVNPSMIPGNQSYIGIPALSGIRLSFRNNGFTWRDLHKITSSDSVTLDVNNALAQLDDKNFISMGFRLNIIECGLHVKQNYLTFSASERAQFNFTFPKELFELVLNGNAQFIGHEVNLRSMAFDITHYREYAFGITRPMSKKVTLGAKFKYLYGMENISSASNNFSFYTAPDDYRLELSSEYRINMSIPGSGGNQGGGYISGFKNTGFGGDLGITYAMSERWKVNASVVDMGFIKWKSNVKNLTTAAGTYTFEGVDIAKFMSDSSSMGNVTDSLSGAFTPVETQEAYTTKIPTDFYANASYKINTKHTAAILLHGESFRGTFQPSMTLSMNSRLTDHFSASISYSMINHHFDNVGAGIVAHMGAVQFYVLSDNWIGTFNPLSNHMTHFNFGFNLVYGRPKKKGPNTMPKITAIPEEFQQK
jgi:hypothetical protein